jgi:LytR cell envelope-related transcriptional attenuator
LKPRGVVVVAIAVAAAAFGVVMAVRSRRAGPSTAPPPPQVRAPDSARVRVQVLNGTKVRGLARRATQLLRDRGFDVVETGTINDTRDTTLVLDVSGHPDWANRVAKLFPPSRVQARPDSSRYLDVVVVLGATWRPPAQPFYP